MFLLIYFTKSLAKRLRHASLHTFHPGLVGTGVFREYPQWLGQLLNLFLASPEKGAQPSLYLATSEEVAGVTGQYFYKTKMKETAARASDEALAEQTWPKTEEMIEGWG